MSKFDKFVKFVSYAVSAAPEVAASTVVMWLVAGCMAMPIN